MDRYNDFYGEPNYTRLFLLFFLFLVALFYRMSNDIYSYVDSTQEEVMSVGDDTCTGDECFAFLG